MFFSVLCMCVCVCAIASSIANRTNIRASVCRRVHACPSVLHHRDRAHIKRTQNTKKQIHRSLHTSLLHTQTDCCCIVMFSPNRLSSSTGLHFILYPCLFCLINFIHLTHYYTRFTFTLFYFPFAIHTLSLYFIYSSFHVHFLLLYIFLFFSSSFYCI